MDAVCSSKVKHIKDSYKLFPESLPFRTSWNRKISRFVRSTSNLPYMPKFLLKILNFLTVSEIIFSTNNSDHYVWSGPPKNHEVEEWMNAYSDYTVQINDGNICGTATCLKNNDIKKLYKWMISHIMSYETLIYILIIFERFGKIMTSSISVVSLFLVRAFSKITFCPTFQSQKSAQFFS